MKNLAQPLEATTAEHQPAYSTSPVLPESGETNHPNKKALRRFLGHRARFSYDDLFCYEIMSACLAADSAFRVALYGRSVTYRVASISGLRRK
jgi:hypothetical protein